MDILYIILGIVIVLRGADNLTDGAVRMARSLKMPELIIGLTVLSVFLCAQIPKYPGILLYSSFE